MTIRTFSRARSATAAFNKAFSHLTDFLIINEPKEVEEGRFTVRTVVKAAGGQMVVDSIRAAGFESVLEILPASEAAPKQPRKATYIRGTSSVDGPVATVWAIASEMRAEDPGVARKDILNACLEAGVTFGTARTQYQAWKNAQK